MRRREQVYDQQADTVLNEFDRLGFEGSNGVQDILISRRDDFDDRHDRTELLPHDYDLYATMLHLLGIDHKQLTHKFQGRNFRLTDIAGDVIKPILA